MVTAQPKHKELFGLFSAFLHSLFIAEPTLKGFSYWANIHSAKIIEPTAEASRFFPKN